MADPKLLSFLSWFLGLIIEIDGQHVLWASFHVKRIGIFHAIIYYHDKVKFVVHVVLILLSIFKTTPTEHGHDQKKSYMKEKMVKSGMERTVRSNLLTICMSSMKRSNIGCIILLS